jgi:hypothetical protein
MCIAESLRAAHPVVLGFNIWSVGSHHREAESWLESGFVRAELLTRIATSTSGHGQQQSAECQLVPRLCSSVVGTCGRGGDPEASVSQAWGI